jgi:amino acid transporter
MASQLGAARLLLSMGQSGAIPAKFFGAVHARNRIPRNNVLLIGAICLVGALVFSYQLGTELLNYGALLAFMGVNVASVVLAWRTSGLKQWLAILSSFLGFAICLFIWLHLGHLAWVVGTAWAAVGITCWGLYGRMASSFSA